MYVGALLTLMIASASAPDPPARFVVVVGYNGGAPDPRPPLSYSDDDAAQLFQLLSPSSERAYLLATFDKDSARRFPGLPEVAQPPTREALAHVLGEISWLVRAQKKAGRKTELVFAFAGHGDVNDGGEGFLVLADGPFSRGDLELQVIEASPADTNHVWIDACSSYFMVRARGDESGAVALSPKILDVLASDNLSAAARARTGVLVSTSSAAEVHESSELTSGVFSFLLRSALAGAADTNGDGRIEYAESATFIAAASADLADPRARLAVHAEAPLSAPHVPMSDLNTSGATRFLRVDSSAPVRLLVMDEHGIPYAELHRGIGHRPILLALAGSTFYVVRSQQKEAVLVPRAAGAYALSSLTFEDAPFVRRRGGHLYGLFERSLTDDLAAGFLASSQMVPPLDTGDLVPQWAPAGEPPLRLPLDVLGVTTLGTAALTAAGAGFAVVMNQTAFAQLQDGFSRTGSLDPQRALDVEGWRNTATALTLGAGTLTVVGGALFLWSMQLDDGALEVVR